MEPSAPSGGSRAICCPEANTPADVLAVPGSALDGAGRTGGYHVVRNGGLGDFFVFRGGEVLE